MKIFASLGLLLVFCLCLMGCPYESSVPISKPTFPVEKKFLGRWESPDEVYNHYTVTEASPTQYDIVQVNTMGDVARYSAFISEVRAIMFLNVFSDSSKKYFLYRIDIDSSGKSFELKPLSKELPEHFSNSEQLRNFILKNMNLISFYAEEDKAVFYKLKREF